MAISLKDKIKLGVIFLASALYFFGPNAHGNAATAAHEGPHIGIPDFEYEKREPIVVPKDFPLVMIPMFHRGSDQSQAVLNRLEQVTRALKMDPQTGHLPLVLWSEAKGVSFPRLRPGLEEILQIPGMKDEIQNQSLAFEDAIRKAREKRDQINPALKHYIDLDSSFQSWNRQGAGAETKEEKKELAQKAVDTKFFANLISWGIDHDAVIVPEQKSFRAMCVILDMFQLAELADLALSHNDLEGSYFYKELEFKHKTEMVYLRDRKIWEQLKKIHELHPNYKIVMPIGQGHAPDFHLASHQLVQAADGDALDVINESQAVEKEIEGKLSPEERQAFLWDDFLKQKLIGQAPDSANFHSLTQITNDLYQRLKAKRISSKQIMQEVGKQLLSIRESNPDLGDSHYRALERKVLLEVLEQNHWIRSEEKMIFEGKPTA